MPDAWGSLITRVVAGLFFSGGEVEEVAWGKDPGKSVPVQVSVRASQCPGKSVSGQVSACAYRFRTSRAAFVVSCR
jgi:hypothetical protein